MLSPVYIQNKWQNPIECLSLTLEEVTHIRIVLTKAELESLITDPELYKLVSKGKVRYDCPQRQDFCIWENKDADQLCSDCTADQRLCFR